jgi:periplasmic protein CpxP/Spy
MKNCILALLLASNLALAQQPGAASSPGGTASPAVQRLQQMAQQLNLSESQKDKILPILVREAPKAKAVTEDPTLPKNEKVARLMEIRNSTDDSVRPILTPDQQTKFDQIRQAQRQQMLQQLQH